MILSCLKRYGIKKAARPPMITCVPTTKAIKSSGTSPITERRIIMPDKKINAVIKSTIMR